jgi:hypothetical protein
MRRAGSGLSAPPLPRAVRGLAGEPVRAVAVAPLEQAEGDSATVLSPFGRGRRRAAGPHPGGLGRESLASIATLVVLAVRIVVRSRQMTPVLRPKGVETCLREGHRSAFALGASSTSGTRGVRSGAALRRRGPFGDEEEVGAEAEEGGFGLDGSGGEEEGFLVVGVGPAAVEVGHPAG